MNNIIEKINWKKIDGLVPAIIQDISTNRVLMLGFMNKEALEKTLETKKVWFFSRTKKRLWMKGEESKNYLKFKSIRFDCDADTLLVGAQPAGPTCHFNIESCFDIEQGIPGEVDIGIIVDLYNVIKKRKIEMPEGSYTTSLFEKGLPNIEAKVMEEAEEVCRAAREETNERVVEESVDVIYHLMALLVEKKVKLPDILKEIKKRRK
ncbi:bifunctional phosphoribosyl-AMP cyclohydrolase/phosphoribosyl-ATP diphosphatase HisIE [Candidatus Parcubacteria bacterium]|jgi:phosphoribosyl-AMP cyclohydrolase / phosphoribosyl-ATP pyrophosphohydrolase|nr:bifunctional phosphoribosyl-AMP cyclohydrolase/phosphoribosyl-ATP diphosphatase HisIE [Candidatus Parcubacteria bacterium]